MKDKDFRNMCYSRNIRKGRMTLVELKRNIYNDLLRWKQRDSGKVLELIGARQTGKTFILDKFAKENYKI